jgi:hypothetical protein
MAWVRLDDRFTENPKILELSDAEFRTWVRLLCHCAHVGDPSVDVKTRREVAGLSKTRIDHFAVLGLLDRLDGAYEVHDWLTYAPKDATSAERVSRFRARKAAAQEPSPQPLHGPLHDTLPEPAFPRVRVQEEGSNNRFEKEDLTGELHTEVRGPLDDWHALATRLSDADEGTPGVLAQVGRGLPEAAIARAIESLEYRRRDSARQPLRSEVRYFIASLKSIREEEHASA